MAEQMTASPRLERDSELIVVNEQEPPASSERDDQAMGSPKVDISSLVVEQPADDATPIEESSKTLNEVALSSDQTAIAEVASPPKLLPSPMDLTIPVKPSLDEIIASHAPESPTTSLITSLRSQLSILSDQSTELNSKLVSAISRHADLEDAHLNLKSSHEELQERAAGLSAEKAKWEESMNTGLLVERSQIKDEMQKLAVGLVEEERRRGSAEHRRQKVEEEIDELAASLFDQANTMVAAERLGRTEAEARLKSTEENLAAAESAMRDMQLHLQSLPTAATSNAPSGSKAVIPRRYLASHLPYTEFIAFISHLRSLRPLKETSKAMFPPPLISNLVAQAFITRAITEDHDPTIRLDAAPDLSYFSRRNVGPAIIAGELIIEPVAAHTVISATTALPHDIGCTLCGKPVFPHLGPQSPSGSQFGPPPVHPGQGKSRFSLKPFFNATSPSGGSTSASPINTPLASPNPAGTSSSAYGSVYVFRVDKVAILATSTEKETKVYPLCRTGWCLERLRATCELWHFVRTGIIHQVWHGEDGHLLQAEILAKERDESTPTPLDRRVSSSSSITNATLAGDHPPPPLPERKKSGGWGLGFKLGQGDRTSSGSNTGGWFNRSASGTPPRSPVASQLDISEKEKGLSDESQGELFAPIDLDSALKENDKGRTDAPEVGGETDRGDVPTIQKVEASPAARLNSNDPEEEGKANADDTLRPGLSRSASVLSNNTSTGGSEEAAFSTPKGQDLDLPDEHEKGSEDGKAEKPVSMDKSASEVEAEAIGGVVDLTEVPTLPISTSSPAPLPPPIPRRAANRTSLQPPSSSATPTESHTPTTHHAPSQLETEEGVKGEVGGSHPPPLPPRHPKTPTAVEIKDHVPEGQKRWIKENSEAWEEKTWRAVVKLKEGMWKARIGVNDELEE